MSEWLSTVKTSQCTDIIVLCELYVCILVYALDGQHSYAVVEDSDR